MSLYFDNNKLFDAEGHLTDEGLYAIKDGTLDDLGALEAAEHLVGMFPGASLGQRLYAARRRANLSAGEAAAVGGFSAELVESAETGKPMDPGTAARVEALIAELAGP